MPERTGLATFVIKIDSQNPVENLSEIQGETADMDSDDRSPVGTAVSKLSCDTGLLEPGF